MSCSDIMCVYVCAYVEAVPLTCYLKNSTEFQLFLEQDLQLRPSIVQQIMAATVDSSKVRRRGRERERGRAVPCNGVGASIYKLVL